MHDRPFEDSPQGRAAPGTPDPRLEVRRLGVRPSRRLSQSFLRRPSVARAMVEAAGLEATDTVLEVGPGLGIVTAELIQRAQRVVAVELDAKLAEALPRALGFPANLIVVQGDALHVNLAGLVEEPYVVVASLPYHVATPLLFRLAFHPPRPSRIVAMLQEEVARRIVPRKGVHTYLEIAFAAVARAKVVARVAPQSFFPVPKVRSTIVRLDLLDDPAVPVEAVNAFVKFVRAGFAHPRQQLHNSLARGLGIPVAAVQTAAQVAGIEATVRPGALDLKAWTRLDRAIEVTAHERGRD